MAQNLSPRGELDPFRCPTCGARQELADVCRRCKCDLSLVVAVHRRRAVLYRRCLRHLGQEPPRAALRAAQQLHALAPDAASARLLGVAQLQCGDFPRALQTLLGDSTPPRNAKPA